jgi:hypothetical protein
MNPQKHISPIKFMVKESKKKIKIHPIKAKIKEKINNFFLPKRSWPKERKKDIIEPESIVRNSDISFKYPRSQYNLCSDVIDLNQTETS